MAKSKGKNGGEIVLTYKRKTETQIKTILVSAQTFKMHNYKGVTVTGEKYYADKAIEAGADKSSKVSVIEQPED